MKANKELFHYGVLGMKWGERRYQNADGTYTSMGRTHYGIGGTRNKQHVATMTDKELQDITKRAKLEKKVTEARATPLRYEKQLLDDTHQLTRTMSDINRRHSNNKPVNQSLDLSNMSNRELQNTINRWRLEQDYTRMYNQRNIKQGRNYVGDFLDYAGDILLFGSSALGVALSYKLLREM